MVSNESAADMLTQLENREISINGKNLGNVDDEVNNLNSWENEKWVKEVFRKIKLITINIKNM